MLTKKDYEAELNRMGAPDAALLENGGIVPSVMAEYFGTWLRCHEPISFEFAFSHRTREG